MLGPMNKNDTAPALHGQFKQGTAGYPLTGLTASAIILHFWQASTSTYKRGIGSVTITDSLLGKFDYHWHQQDTNTPGLWDVWAELRTSDGLLSSTNVEPLQVYNRVRATPYRAVGRLALSE